MPNQLTKAAEIVRELQAWIDRKAPDHDGKWEANCELARGRLFVNINNIGLWDSHRHSEANLTTDFCKQQFCKHAKSLAVFAEGAT